MKVAKIEPGEFFGEMSLLAGEPRSATISTLAESVVFEITRESFVDLLSLRPEIGEVLSRIIAQRQFATSSMVDIASNSEKEDEIMGNAHTLLRKMSSVFGMVLGGKV